VYVQSGPKSKPLPNYQNIVLNCWRIRHRMSARRLWLFIFLEGNVLERTGLRTTVLWKNVGSH